MKRTKLSWKEEARQRAKHRRKRRITLLALGVLVVSIVASAVYGLTYSESSNAFNQVTVYCFSPGPAIGHGPGVPLTHYAVTIGARNPSSVDMKANWTLQAVNKLWPNYQTTQDGTTFSIPKRDTALGSFTIFISLFNATIKPSDLKLVQMYNIALFTFQRDSGALSDSMPSCE